MLLWPIDSPPPDGDLPDRALPAVGLAGALFAAAGDAMLLVDPPAERLLDVNPMAETLSRQPRHQLLGRGLRDILDHETAADRWLSRVQQTTGFQGQDGFLFHAVGPEERIPVRASLVRLDAAAARPLALLTLRDRREQVEANRRLLRMETHRLESLGVLAGGIAHDFNNLLTGILGNAGLARLSCTEGSPLLPQLEQIEIIAVRAADLCKQMLAFAGKSPSVIQPIDLNALVRETAELMRVRLSGQAELRFDLAIGLPAVQSDESQLRQIVMNLLLNASEALNEQPGVIRLATGLTRFVAGAERLRTASDPYFFPAQEMADGEYVVLEVQDTGLGMPPEIIWRIFEPFFTTKFTGRGLGLAAVLGIVRSYKGGIHVTSAVGQGTTMRVFLPQVIPAS